MYGYFMNGLYGYKFDLGSCWQGITGALMGLLGGFAKYITDSRFNSLLGKIPVDDSPQVFQENVDKQANIANKVVQVVDKLPKESPQPKGDEK